MMPYLKEREPKNHTLSHGTYSYSPYMVVAPVGTGFKSCLSGEQAGILFFISKPYSEKKGQWQSK